MSLCAGFSSYYPGFSDLSKHPGKQHGLFASVFHTGPLPEAMMKDDVIVAGSQ